MLAEAVTKSAGTEEGEGPMEVLEAVQELFPRFADAPTRPSNGSTR